MASTTGEVTVLIAGEPGIVQARQAARQLAASLGFTPMDQTRITTAVSELARNVVRYATDGKGTVLLRPIGPAPAVGLEIVVSDDGPGIADVEQAMVQGFSSGAGLGLGLGGTRRLSDEMDIVSAPGEGTTVTVRKWKR